MEDLGQGIESIPIFGPPCANSFKYVKTNVPGPGCDVNLFMDEFEGCPCDKTCSKETCPCFNIFGQAYANGFLLESAFSPNKPARSIIECGKNCSCEKSTCALRLVQKGIQRKLKVIETAGKGYGLVTEREIARLAFVCEYAGEVVSESEAQKRLQECEQMRKMNYLIAIKEQSVISQNQTFVDPRQVGNIGRFINHSCDPNLIMIPVRVNHCIPRLALFAKRNISSGEELTFDYSGRTFLNTDTTLRNKCNTITQTSSEKPVSRKTSDISQNCLFKETNSIECPSKNKELMKKRKINQESSNDASISHSKFDPSVCEFCWSAGQTLVAESSSLDSTVVNEVQENSSHDSANESLPAHALNYQRTKCFCGSENCSGYLPYDGYLFKKP